MLTATAFILAYGTGCLLALLRHPIYGLLTYVGLLYLHPPSRWWSVYFPSLRWSLIAAAITLLAVLIHRKPTGQPSVFMHGPMRGLLILVAWLGVQSFWALDPSSHSELLVMAVKYTLLMALIYECVDSTKHLKYFLWAHAGGCFYLGIVVITEYVGGRFEGFQGPGIDEANAAALQIVTGVIITFVLFLSGKWKEKLVAVGFMPFTLNALVATISRSGFLALGVAGVIFNLFAPKKIRTTVRGLSLVGLVLFISLTNPVYWERIYTILVAGEQVEGVDTGIGRIVLIDAQWQMFTDHPLGCGHRCTATLSPMYLEDRYLTGKEGNRARSSHNTFMTLLVEQGILGVVLYALLLIWIARTTFRLRRNLYQSIGLIPNTYAATVAILGAITVGDMFVDYLKFETRVWFLAILMVIDRMASSLESSPEENEKELIGLASDKKKIRG